MWHSLFSFPKNILIMYLIPWNKGKSCHMDGPSLMVQQVFGNPTYRLTFRKRRILDHYLRFCNWSGVSGNGFLGLSKYFISLCAVSILVHESVRTVNPNLAVALQALYIYIYQCYSWKSIHLVGRYLSYCSKGELIFLPGGFNLSFRFQSWEIWRGPQFLSEKCVPLHWWF